MASLDEEPLKGGNREWHVPKGLCRRLPEERVEGLTAGGRLGLLVLLLAETKLGHVSVDVGNLG